MDRNRGVIHRKEAEIHKENGRMWITCRSDVEKWEMSTESG